MPINPEVCCNGLLRQATRRVTQFYDRRLASSGLKSTQLNVLMHIDFLGEPTLKTLAQRLIMDLSALGHSLKPLERDGLIELVADPGDGRARRVRPTTTGTVRFVEAIALWRKAQNDLETVIGVTRAQELHSLLGVLVSGDFERALREIETVA
jgi:DNA-binding MarR family transcriptional regulator